MYKNISEVENRVTGIQLFGQDFLGFYKHGTIQVLTRIFGQSLWYFFFYTLLFFLITLFVVSVDSYHQCSDSRVRPDLNQV